MLVSQIVAVRLWVLGRWWGSDKSGQSSMDLPLNYCNGCVVDKRDTGSLMDVLCQINHQRT